VDGKASFFKILQYDDCQWRIPYHARQSPPIQTAAFSGAKSEQFLLAIGFRIFSHIENSEIVLAAQQLLHEHPCRMDLPHAARAAEQEDTGRTSRSPKPQPDLSDGRCYFLKSGFLAEDKTAETPRQLLLPRRGLGFVNIDKGYFGNGALHIVHAHLVLEVLHRCLVLPLHRIRLAYDAFALVPIAGVFDNFQGLSWEMLLGHEVTAEIDRGH
jgi:hypothetical protein